MDLRAFAQRVGSRARSWPAAACSGSRPPTRCSSSGCKTVVLERSRQPAAPPARRARRRAAAPLPRRARASRSCSTPRSERVDAGSRLRAVHLRDGRRLEAQILLVAAGHPAERRARARRAAARSTAACVVDDRMRTERPGGPGRGRRRRVRGPGARPVADRGRAGRGGGRERRRRRQGLRAAWCRSRSSRWSASSWRRSAASRRPGRRGGDRARGRGRRPLPQARDLRAAGSSARSCSATATTSPPCAPRSRAASTSATHLDTLRAGRWDVLAQLSGDAAARARRRGVAE